MAQQSGSDRPRTPNFVVIFCDDLGDARTGITGTGCRPAGRVDNPRTLLPVPTTDPWVRAVYD